jgi:hypothetical protein
MALNQLAFCAGMARAAPAFARPAGISAIRHFHNTPQLRQQQQVSFFKSS